MSGCKRAWELEAARDGRLRGAALASSLEHAQICDACGADRQALDELGARLRADPADELHVRRLRAAVLGRANEAMATPTEVERPARRLRWAALAAAVCIAGLAGGWRATHAPASRVTPPPGAALATESTRTTLTTTNEGGARFTETSSADALRIDLLEGQLAVRVRRAPGGQRVVVHVPDGVIEDIGTVFHVRVSGGHTEVVYVDEGRVIVHIGRAGPEVVAAGQAWSRGAPLAATAQIEPVSSPSSSSSSPPSSPSGAAAVSAARPRPAKPARAEDPQDQEADEDAAYLAVVRLLREGRGAEAKAAARRYVVLFPDGFRRKEMDRVAE